MHGIRYRGGIRRRPDPATDGLTDDRVRDRGDDGTEKTRTAKAVVRATFIHKKLCRGYLTARVHGW